ncbi:MAG: EAL domain-containing protein [Haliea sp.]|nr:EAL domain-containing protein [Haliea sp.]
MKDSLLHPPSDTVSPQQDVEVALLHDAYARLRQSLLMIVTVSCIFAGFLWPFFPTPLMTIWVIVILSVAGARYLLWKSFQRAQGQALALARWRRLFWAGSAAAGAAWALGPTLMMPEAGSAEPMLFVGTLLSVCAVAISTQASQQAAMQVFIAAALAPPAIALLNTGGDVERVTATILIAGLVTLIVVGRRSGKEMRHLLEAQFRIQEILNTAMDAVIGMDVHGKITDWNFRAEAIFGRSKGEVLGSSFQDTIFPERIQEEKRQELARFLATRDDKILKQRVETTGMRRSGEEFPIELTITPLSTNNTWHFTAFIEDITERKRAEKELLETNQKLALQFDQAPLGVIEWDRDFRVVQWNPAAEKIFGFSAEQALGQHASFIVPEAERSNVDSVMNELLSGTGGGNSVNENVRRNGESIQCDWYNAPLRDATGEVVGAISLVDNITSRKLAEDEIRNLAFYDHLTGLPNRRLLIDRVRQAMASSGRSAKYCALLFLDLDNFKTLNDTLGHDIGDLLLQQVANRVSSCVRNGDTVARLGGDEFVVLLEELSEFMQEAVMQTETVGSKILAAFTQPYQLDNYEHLSTTSIGVTLFAHHDSSTDDLLKRADLAMYQAKAEGRNTLRFFDPEMQTAVMTRAAMEESFREALLNDQFELHYQAQVTAEGQISGAEVLLRWLHPGRGMVSPVEFIPFAEETGLILPLGRWVLETACAQLAQWAMRPEMAHLSVAVNVSSRQLKHPNFVDEVLGILDHSGANPHRLKMELTESLLVDDVEDAITKMTALKAKGVGFSLDDFGTGYSSLSYLKRLPLDQLKIDQGFVKHVLTDPNDMAIAKMIIVLADSLGLAVIAEGVETHEQRNFLADLGCLAYQGFLISRPLALDTFEEFVINSARPEFER